MRKEHNMWDGPEPAEAPPGEKRKRHRWVKIRIHFYVCRDCGIQKQNSEGGQPTYHRPDGVSRVEFKTPACVKGEKTDEYLERFKDDIAVHDDPRIRHRYRAWSQFNPNCCLCGLLEHDKESAHV